MKPGKLIGGIGLAALAAGLIPYSVKQDPATGACEVRSLLWVWRKTIRDGKKSYDFACPPSGLEREAAAQEPAKEA